MNVKNDICVIRDSLLDWLREHRHGVMGTVIFHLVLAIFLVCVGISRLDSQQRMEIEIDMPEPEIVQQKQEEQEKKEMELLAKHKVNFIVLARYMQVISEKMINAYPNRIINIHHSFLPAFVGAKPYHAAFERGVKIIGATSHYVTTELDAGPIIEQDVVRITHKDTVQDLVNKGKDLEKIVLSRAVQKHIERKVLAYKNKTVIFN